MSFPGTITLLFNGLTLALALGFLLIVLSQEMRKELNQFFAVFLFLVMLWNAGSLLAQALSLVDPESPLMTVAIGIMELGFTGSSVAAYVLAAVLIGTQSRRFYLLAFASLLVVLGYQLFLMVSDTHLPIELVEDGTFTYRLQPLSSVFYIVFDGATLYIIWRYHRKIKSRMLIIGIALFAVGQSLGFLNPELRALSISLNTSSLATLIISFAILRQEFIVPLAERVTQVEAMHKVSLAISSQIGIDTVLNQIATQAAGWLDADAAGIFLNVGNELELSTVYNLPGHFTQSRLKLGQGIAGTVAETHQSIRLENYRLQWRGEPDLPLAHETFGSVICVPLVYIGEVIGVLMVVSGHHGRLFEREHVHLLELLGAQAAVAIAHSQLFADQRELTHQVEAACSQLETLLISTENPVVAVNRRFRLIFANPAAKELFSFDENVKESSITDLLPAVAFPPHYRDALRDLRRSRVHVYEISLGDQVFLCHLAGLGPSRTAGWVAVLNDVTKLKELDRLKSEMVRMTCHDLKNPLQAAMAHLELLDDDLSQGEGAAASRTIAVIQNQLERMNRIIGGILDLERVETGMPTMELSSPEHTVRCALDEVSDLARERTIRLEVNIGTDAKFLADPMQFQRALTNLIENAIKFTLSGGMVNISVKRDPEEDRVVFQVEDTGIGIPEELQAMVFDRFFRGGQKGQKGAEHISGSGLGLSLVKTIVENHSGRVWLKSKEGQGTTFFMSVPAAKEPANDVTSHSQ
jgi:signal transduction histidine kinase